MEKYPPAATAVNSHLNVPKQQSDHTSAFLEVIFDDQLIMCIGLAAPGYCFPSKAARMAFYFCAQMKFYYLGSVYFVKWEVGFCVLRLGLVIAAATSLFSCSQRLDSCIFYSISSLPLSPFRLYFSSPHLLSRFGVGYT